MNIVELLLQYRTNSNSEPAGTLSNCLGFATASVLFIVFSNLISVKYKSVLFFNLFTEFSLIFKSQIVNEMI